MGGRFTFRGAYCPFTSLKGCSSAEAVRTITNIVIIARTFA
jgi:hypothetical protein